MRDFYLYIFLHDKKRKKKQIKLYNVNIIIPRYKRICTISQRKFINTN